MPIQIQDTERGTLFQFGSANVHLPTGSIGFSEPALINRLRGLPKEHAGLAADLKPEVLPERFFDIHGASTLAIVRTSFNVAQSEARDAMAADATFMTPVRAVDPAVAAWTWNTYRAMDAGSQGKAVQSADLDTLAALVTFEGNRGGLAPAVYDTAIERYRTLNVVEKMGLQARFAAQPSIEGRVLAVGPDMAAAQAEARSVLSDHAARLEAVDQNERTAKALLTFLSAIFGKSPAEILDRVLGRPSGVASA